MLSLAGNFIFLNGEQLDGYFQNQKFFFEGRAQLDSKFSNDFNGSFEEG